MDVTHGSLAHGARSARRPESALAVTVGSFDGVHRGHRAMLERLVAKGRALGIGSCVLTFEPHPREFFAPAAAPARLSRLREKLERIAETGVDRVHVLRFDAQLAALSAEAFIAEVLAQGLGTRWLLVGRDFRFGAGRRGDCALLEAGAGRHGYVLEAMPDVTDAGERVSSSAVRAALAAGDLERARELLGRPYMMSGRVAHGEKLGRSLGFPTANIALRRRPPLAGIFVVEAELEEAQRVMQGVASVGRRPTVRPDAAPLLEVHLFDFEGTLYGRHLRVTFLEKLREEQKYEGLEALRAAIARDAARAADFFARRIHA